MIGPAVDRFELSRSLRMLHFGSKHALFGARGVLLRQKPSSEAGPGRRPG